MIVPSLVTHEQVCQRVHCIVEADHFVDLLVIIDISLELFIIRQVHKDQG